MEELIGQIKSVYAIRKRDKTGTDWYEIKTDKEANDHIAEMKMGTSDKPEPVKVAIKDEEKPKKKCCDKCCDCKCLSCIPCCNIKSKCHGCKCLPCCKPSKKKPTKKKTGCCMSFC